MTLIFGILLKEGVMLRDEGKYLLESGRIERSRVFHFYGHVSAIALGSERFRYARVEIGVSGIDRSEVFFANVDMTDDPCRRIQRIQRFRIHFYRAQIEIQ